MTKKREQIVSEITVEIYDEMMATLKKLDEQEQKKRELEEQQAREQEQKEEKELKEAKEGGETQEQEEAVDGNENSNAVDPQLREFTLIISKLLFHLSQL